MTGGRVVVIGPTGRNFAAGMSGGIAYIVDAEKQFEKLCNHGMVELEAVVDPEEQEWLKDFISRHQLLTGSGLASNLLKDWERNISKFIKVMPTEYRMVLEQQKLKAA
jgi:glutamate synthase (NADPH) large chain